MNDVTTTNDRYELAPHAPSPLAIIETAVKNNVPAAELKQLMDLQCQWEAARAQEAYAEALANFQSECPIIKKATEGHGYRYATYDDIMRQIRDLLAANRITLQFSVDGNQDTNVTIRCRVRVGSYYEDHTFTCPTPAMNKMVNDTQKAGAALSYAKRYCLCAALNIVTANEDDDARGLTNEPQEEPKITARQAKELSGRIEGLGMDHEKYISWLAAKNKSIRGYEDIPASWWANLDAGLKKKEAKQAEEIEQGTA